MVTPSSTLAYYTQAFERADDTGEGIVASPRLNLATLITYAASHKNVLRVMPCEDQDEDELVAA